MLILVFFYVLCFLPADTSALDSDCDLTLRETLASLDLLFTGLCLGDPEVVGRVGVNTNVLHGRLERGGSCGGRHLDGGGSFATTRGFDSSESKTTM